MKRVIALIAFTLLVAACDEKEDSGPRKFHIELESIAPLGAEDYKVRLRIYPHLDYDGTAQEIHGFDPDWPDPNYTDIYLIEYFDKKNYIYQVDQHTIGPDEFRQMKLYPADVQGITADQYGYAQLQENMDCSLVTDPYLNYNPSHSNTYPRTGQVTKEGNPIYWSMDTRSGQFILIIAGEVIEQFALP